MLDTNRGRTAHQHRSIVACSAMKSRFAAAGVWGSLRWEDAKGTRWVLTPIGVRHIRVQGSKVARTSRTGIVALKLDERADSCAEPVGVE